MDNWPVGLMDKASASGARDSRFESWAGHGQSNMLLEMQGLSETLEFGSLIGNRSWFDEPLQKRYSCLFKRTATPASVAAAKLLTLGEHNRRLTGKASPHNRRFQVRRSLWKPFAGFEWNTYKSSRAVECRGLVFLLKIIHDALNLSRKKFCSDSSHTQGG